MGRNCRWGEGHPTLRVTPWCRSRNSNYKILSRWKPTLGGQLDWNRVGISYDPNRVWHEGCREPREAPSSVGGDPFGIFETRVRIEYLHHQNPWSSIPEGVRPFDRLPHPEVFWHPLRRGGAPGNPGILTLGHLRWTVDKCCANPAPPSCGPDPVLRYHPCGGLFSAQATEMITMSPDFNFQANFHSHPQSLNPTVQLVRIWGETIREF